LSIDSRSSSTSGPNKERDRDTPRACGQAASVPPVSLARVPQAFVRAIRSCSIGT
jgi:hypothetical protein